MDDGITINRQALGLFGDALSKGIFISIMALADKAGCVNMSVNAFSNELGVGRQMVRTVIDKLVKHGMATKDATKASTNQLTKLTLNDKAIYNSPHTSKKPTAQPPNQPSRETPAPLLAAVIERPAYGFVHPDFAEAFTAWLEYKEKQFKFKYKTERSLKAVYDNLLNLSSGDPAKAMQIVDQSMSNGWKGLFELKENGTKQLTSTSGMAARKEGRDKGLFLASEIVSKSEDIISLYDGSGVLADPC